jgi:hypothetical protein
MPIRSSLYCLVVIAGAFVLSALAVALPHDPYIRWQSFSGTMFERARIQYERLHFDPAPVDVLFVGSSRTAAGINPPMLEAYLREKGHPLRVLDMSLPASGMDIRVAQVREALRAKPGIKLIVIDVPEGLPRDGHQAFGDLAPAPEVLSSPLLVNRNLPASILRLPMRQMKLAVETALPEAYGFQARFNPALYPGSAFDFNGGNTADEAARTYLTQAHRAALQSESDRRKREIVAPILPEDLAFLEFGVSRSSLDEITALAEAHGARVAFLFLPFYQGYKAPRDADWISQHGALWTAEWMMTDPRYYKDAAHSSVIVLEPLNRWVGDRIIAELGDPRKAAAADARR